MKLAPAPFDSAFYGLSIGRATIEGPDDRVDALIAAARADGYAVVYVRVGETDPFAAALARAGHTPVDTLITSTLARPAPAIESRAQVAIEHCARVDHADAVTVGSITASSIVTSHLHQDRRLPRDQTRALYAAWAKNDVTGRAQHVIVAREAGEIVGYCAVLVASTTVAIDLIATAVTHHGRGIGSAMLAAFIAWVPGDVVATVGTQSDNPALGLYRRCGFVPTATDLTYHLWLQ